MADIARMCERNPDPLETLIDNSETGLFLVALILSNNALNPMIMDRRALTRIPNERNDGKAAIDRSI